MEADPLSETVKWIKLPVQQNIIKTVKGIESLAQKQIF